MEDVNNDNNEGEFRSLEESDEPSTNSSEIRRRLGPHSDLGFIIVYRKWLEYLAKTPAICPLLCPCPAILL